MNFASHLFLLLLATTWLPTRGNASESFEISTTKVKLCPNGFTEVSLTGTVKLEKDALLIGSRKSDLLILKDIGGNSFIFDTWRVPGNLWMPGVLRLATYTIPPRFNRISANGTQKIAATIHLKTTSAPASREQKFRLRLFAYGEDGRKVSDILSNAVTVTMPLPEVKNAKSNGRKGP